MTKIQIEQIRGHDNIYPSGTLFRSDIVVVFLLGLVSVNSLFIKKYKIYNLQYTFE